VIRPSRRSRVLTDEPAASALLRMKARCGLFRAGRYFVCSCRPRRPIACAICSGMILVEPGNAAK